MEVERSAAEAAYLEAFGSASEALPTAKWLEPAREAARTRFAETGLPHRRLEAWRWTDLRTIVDREFPPSRTADGAVDAATLDGSPFAGLDHYRAVFVDGHYQAGLSDIDGLSEQAECVLLAGGLDDAPAWLEQHFGQAYPQDDDALIALNTALMADGVALRVPEGRAVDKPLELVFIGTGASPQTLSTRNLILVEAGAEVTVLETHMGPSGGRYVANTATECIIRDGATLDHVKVQNESAEAIHLANLHAAIGAKAKFNTFALNAGSAVTRSQYRVKLGGEGGDTNIASAYMLADRQHCDTALLVDHAVAGCTSNELFKCVMDDTARGIFQGKIIVRPDAQQTDGMQMTQGLLLSEHAEFDAKPELEIFADDVRCTHGATSGELDEDLMFYLRSRGIAAEDAKALLIAAFVGEAIEQVSSEQLRGALNGFVAGLGGYTEGLSDE
ncbi:MAG: Fe-S cluster assembly protein SufD [Hyphomicrobiales bacterium]